MTPADQPLNDDQFEEYLDNLLDGAERAAVQRALAGDPARQADAELQGRIDASLARLFRAGPPSERQVAAMLAAAQGPVALPLAASRSLRMWWLAVAVAAAAAVGWLLVGWPRHQTSGRDVAAAVRPLSDVYRESLANGFEPAYECSRADRFADTFNRRQGQPLKLMKLPEGVRMLGLAYPGGLSRDTTAMLARVDGKPVMVFVDRADADKSSATQHCDKSVHVYRAERDGLVFYEVTPLDGPRVTEFLAPPSASGAGELPAA